IPFVGEGKRGSDSRGRAAPAPPRGRATFFPSGRTATKPWWGRQPFGGAGARAGAGDAAPARVAGAGQVLDQVVHLAGGDGLVAKSADDRGAVEVGEVLPGGLIAGPGADSQTLSRIVHPWESPAIWRKDEPDRFASPPCRVSPLFYRRSASS